MCRHWLILIMIAGLSVGEEGRAEPIRGRDAWRRERIELPLKQLAAIQDVGGSWSEPQSSDDPSALCALAFLSAGYDHKTPSRHKLTVKKAIGFQLQDDASAMGIRNRALRLIVVAEAYAMTNDPELRGPVEERLRSILALRLPSGGWPAQPGGNFDWPASAAVIMAMKSVRSGGLDVSMDDTAAWWLRVAGDEDRLDNQIWKAAAGAMFGETTRPQQRILVDYLLETLPAGPIAPRETWACTIASFPAGGEAWETWKARLMASAPPSAETPPGIQATQVLADNLLWLIGP